MTTFILQLKEKHSMLTFKRSCTSQRLVSEAREVEGQLAGYLLGWRRDFLGKIVLAWLVFFHLIFNFQGLLVF